MTIGRLVRRAGPHGVIRCGVLVLLVLLSHSASSGAQEPPGCALDPELPTYPVEAGTDPCGQPGWISRCWRRQHGGTSALSRPTAAWDGEGLPLNLDPTYGVAPADFLPRTVAPAESSLPLLPRALVRDFLPRPGEERPVLAGVVDLLTGVPLLQAVDLELPFGGAVFRQVRTYSEVPEAVGRSIDGGVASIREAGAFWDWCGRGWMTGANPILLIDGAWRDIVGSSARRAYFIPDAHHAIPFELDEQTGLYLPQPRFRATLTHDGTWNSGAGAWGTRPTTMTVSLYDGAVRYTIAPSWEDVGRYETDGGVRSGHERPDLQFAPDGAPAGTRYLGIVKRIEDRHGNRVEMVHAGDLLGDELREWHLPDPEAEAAGCWHCAQQCVDKGQLRAIKCYAPDEPSAIWTVLFQHRRFNESAVAPAGTDDPWWAPENGWLKQQTAIHAIYAFNEDLDLAADIDHEQFQWTLPSWYFWIGPGKLDAYRAEPPTWDGLDWLESQDDFETYPEFGPSGLPDGWTHQVQYRYSEAGRSFNGNENRAWILEDARPACDRPGGVGHLLMARTVTRRESGGIGAPPEEHRGTVYRYGEQVGVQKAPLTHVFESDAVDKIMHRLRSHDPIEVRLDAEYPEPLHDNDVHDRWSPYWLLRLRTDQQLPKLEGDTSDAPSLGEAATLVLHRSSGDANGGRSHSPFTDVLNRGYIQADPSRLLAHNSSSQGVVALEVRAADGEHRAFLLHRFMQLPAPDPADPYPTLGTGQYAHVGGPTTHRRFDVGRSILHVPYRWEFAEGGQRGEVPASPLDQPVWICAVDRLDPGSDVLAIRPFDALTEASLRELPIPQRRRVVYANATGQVLKQRTWMLDDAGDGTVIEDEGFLESFLHDEHGRVTEHRSVGWGTLDPGGTGSPSEAQRTEGRIDVYGYADVGDEPPMRDPVRVGVKRGTDGEIEWVFERESHPDRPDLISVVREFPEPGRMHETRTAFVMSDDPDCAGCVLERRSWTLAASIVPGGPELHRVEVSRYDESGRMIWNAYGMAEDPMQPGAHDSDILHLDHNVYDDRGRTLVAVSDFAGDPSDPPANWPAGVPVSQFPDGLQRSPPHVAGSVPPSDSLALQRATLYKYGQYGLESTTSPNGLTSVTRYQHPSDDETVIIEYRGLVPLIRGSTDQFTESLEPGTRMELEGTTVVRRQQVIWTNDGSGIDPNDRNPAFTPVRDTVPSYDERGRLVGMQVQGADGDGASRLKAAFEYGQTGGVRKSVTPEGMITRTVHDRRGRQIARFIGSQDEHPYWGSLAEGARVRDDMILVESTEYGAGVCDADRPILIRQFRTPPESQYDDLGDSAAATVAQRRHYDWKQRHVVTETMGADEAPLQFVATLLDQTDATRFVAVYAEVFPWGTPVDPTSRAPGAAMPSAATFLAQSVRPVRLSETVYDQRGNVREVRAYDVSDGSYQAAITFRDHDERVVFSAGPTGPAQHTRFNAFGHATTIRTLALGAGQTIDDAIELQRVDIVRNTLDHGIETRTLERRPDASGGVLSSGPDGNAIEARRYQWFRADGRRLVTLDLGSASDSGLFENDRPFPERGSFASPPVLFDELGQFIRSSDPLGGLPTGAMLRWHEYDDRARSTARYEADEYQPAGYVVERLVYDDLDRVIERIANADGQPHERVHTAYQFDGSSLTAIASVHSGHVEAHGGVRFSARDETIEVARLKYGAPIVDEAGRVVSADPGAVGLTMLPGGGVIGVANTTDGLLAGRRDERGVRLRYGYDPFGAIVSMTAADVTGGRLSGQASTVIERDTLSRPTRIATFDEAGVRITENRFEYDGSEHVVREHQQIGDDEALYVIAYEWEPAGGHGQGGAPARLRGVRYPLADDAANYPSLGRRYGADAGINDAADRVTSVRATLSGRPESDEQVVSIERGGATRITGLSIGASGPRWSAFATDGTAVGIDRHGRARQRVWGDPADGASLFRGQYSYDRRSNRISEALDGIGTGDASGSTQDYRYDGLGRLLHAKLDEPSAVSMAWRFDDLGNWVGDDQSPGLDVRSRDGEWKRSVTDTVGAGSALIERRVDTEPQEVRSCVTNPVGDLISDGRNAYRYDAWRRLIEVRAIGSVEFDETGTRIAGTFGPARLRLTYDGLGRLVHKEVPGGPAERVFYDGSQPVQIADAADRLKPVLLESWILHPERIDEPLAISRPGGILDAVLHDPFGNMVGTATELAHPLQGIRFGPYGSMVSLFDYGANAPPPRLGLHGMQVLRLDGAGGLLADDPRGESEMLLHARNRVYHPGLGRFLQLDPNMTGLPTANASSMSGSSPSIAAPGIDLEHLYTDGPNLHAFVGGNPLNRRDPSGLIFGGIGGGLMAGLNGAEMALDGAQQGLYAAGMGASLNDMLMNYAFDQMLDFDWALDLSMPDNWHSRSGIRTVALYGGDAEASEAEDGLAYAKGRPPRKVAYSKKRQHGGAAHWGAMRTEAKAILSKTPKANRRAVLMSMRTNQALVDSKGNMVSNLRPDIQYRNPKTGKIDIVEVYVKPNKMPRGRRKKFRQSLGSEAGKIYVINI